MLTISELRSISMIKATEFLECFQICRDAQEGLSRYSAEKCLPANSKEFSSLTAEKVFLCMAVVCGHELTFPKMHPVGWFGDDNREQLNVRHFLCISGELLNMSMMHPHGEEGEDEAGPPPIHQAARRDRANQRGALHRA